jgi:hypothetical protein
MKKTKKEIQNRLILDLQNLIYEHQLGTLTEEIIYGYFSDFLLSADVDSDIIVNVLEQENFGQKGKEAARYIKIDEGW